MSRGSDPDGAVVIMGAGGIFPRVRPAADFWRNAIGKVGCIRELPVDRPESVFTADAADPGCWDTRNSGFVPGVRPPAAYDPPSSESEEGSSR